MTKPCKKWFCRKCGSAERNKRGGCIPCGKISSDTAKRRHQMIKAQLVAFYNNVCMDCGKVYPPCVYDFHHIDKSNKSFAVSEVRSFEEALEESKKCVMICSNCHRIRHTKEAI